MTAEPGRNSQRDDADRIEGERRHLEDALDEALANTFPASDPVSIEQPTGPVVHHHGAKP
jgi:hypothetical protein